MNKQNKGMMHIPVREAFAGSDMFSCQRSSRAFHADPGLQRSIRFYPLATDQSLNLFNRPQSKLMVHVISV